MDLYDFANDWIADSAKEANNEKLQSTGYGFRAALTDLFTSVVAVAQSVLSVKMHDLRETSTDYGWACSTAAVQAFQSVTGGMASYCSYMSCKNEEDVADVRDDGKDNDSINPQPGESQPNLSPTPSD